jgi:hypothetical protein
LEKDDDVITEFGSAIVMSALGQKQTSRSEIGHVRFTPKADIRQRRLDVR